MDVRIEELLVEQEGVVARWQLLERGVPVDRVRHFARSARRLHAGVWVTGHAPLHRRQIWWAAALSAPRTVVSQASAGAAWRFRPWEGSYEVVTRPGSGGPRRFAGLLVCRSTTLAGHVTSIGGIPVTNPERTIADLAASLGPRATTKCVREAVRLKATTMKRLALHLGRSGTPSGTALLRAYVARHSLLPFHRCRSDAEARALEVLDAAGHPIPRVNERVAGEEADLSWPDRRLIVEIDGPDFHRFRDEDARKTAVWRAAGWTVRRVPSGIVFDDPAAFLAVVRA